MAKPVIAITSGDPCGIGPEVILKALRGVGTAPHVRWLVIGDLRVFQQLAKRLRRRLPPWQVIPDRADAARAHGRMLFLDCGHRGRFTPGATSRGAGAASLDYLKEAIALWKAKQAHALVTGPVTKWAVAQSVPGFVGQTEWLAAATRTRDVVMLFASERLRVALLTRHLPLKRVAAALNRRVVEMTITLLHGELRRRFHIARPRIAVCGINPHAGEEGRLGSEERRIIAPALRALRRARIACEGPFAADGLFPRAGDYDAIVCAYHDQALIPFKLAARDTGCQVSVGLPLVRTSPDHGSALDIAGQGRANPGSMRSAMRLALALSQPA